MTINSPKFQPKYFVQLHKYIIKVQVYFANCAFVVNLPKFSPTKVSLYTVVSQLCFVGQMRKLVTKMSGNYS